MYSFFSVAYLIDRIGKNMFLGAINGAWLIECYGVLWLYILLYVWSRISSSTRCLNVSCGYTWILIGAYSNLLDRGVFGFVIDNIEIHWKLYDYWFTYDIYFNLADVYISTGVVLAIFRVLSTK